MAAILFKRRYLPNADGTDSATALTDANTAFVHTYQGDDNTGDGTRAKPYKSVYKASQKSGITYILFRGVANEYFSTTKTIIGDDLNQTIITVNYSPSFIVSYNLTIDAYKGLDGSGYVQFRLILNKPGSNGYPQAYLYCMFKSYGLSSANNWATDKYNTYNGLGFNITSDTAYGTPSLSNSPIKNSIFANVFNLVSIQNNGVAYCVILSTTVFKYNGINIIQPNWTNDTKANVALLRSALVAAGMTSLKSSYLFPQDSFGNEICRVVKEIRAGGTCKNVFNRYADNLTGTLSAAITSNSAKTSITLTVADSSKFAATGDIFVPNSDGSGSEVFTYTGITINSGTSITFTGSSYTFKVAHDANCTCTRYGDVIDFNLNPDPLNEALFASDTGGYVGCFKAATPVSSIATDSFATPINVNADGSDDVVSGTMLVKNADDSLTFQTGTGQTWNRLKSATTIVIPTARKFNGLGCMSQDGSPFGCYFGKHQNLIDSTALTPANTLLANTWYKVCNATAGTYQAVVYNGVQYLPDYFFNTGSGLTSFTLLNSDSGTVVKKVLASPLESIEILPYDDANTPSTSLPKFSAPLQGDCKMLFYKAGNSFGKTAGTPVLFGDTQVSAMTDKISYYLGTTVATGWAVTNADQEFVTLSADTTNYYYDYPTLKYLRLSINAHFSADYDQ